MYIYNLPANLRREVENQVVGQLLEIDKLTY